MAAYDHEKAIEYHFIYGAVLSSMFPKHMRYEGKVKL